MTVAGAWAAYCGEVASAPLPASVEARARLCVADHVHAAMHGARSDTATMLRRYFDRGEASHAGAADAESAALYAGTISAVHEIDDVHQDVAAPRFYRRRRGDACAGGWTSFEATAAIVAGYEIAVVVCRRGAAIYFIGRRPAAPGAAAAGSIVLSLDDERSRTRSEWRQPRQRAVERHQRRSGDCEAPASSSPPERGVRAKLARSVGADRRRQVPRRAGARRCA